MPMSIRERIKRAQKQIDKQTKVIKSLQAKCPHVEYREGISIVARVHEVLYCKECNHMKAIDYPRPNSVVPQWRIVSCVDKPI